ncbi:hypothetical protein CRE_18426 [Caenorhabditis remanei]|uniref:7TM GPCR serpentine receptor class x (Srx) domain-containing protein n=1 Tax=Caenorhabditis remanei TaxID=31234 RepID=E3LK96_CAERE|nr:hypothetical protein CRE_18426 [Caenorhabditis remanei]
MTQPTCQYFLLKNPHEPTVIPLSFFITLLSTVINFLGFYVILYKSKKETKLFKFTLFGNLNFPDCSEVFNLPGVLIITNVNALYALLGLMALTGIAAEGVYIISSVLMLFELSKQTRKMSNNNFNHQRKVVVDTTIQIVIKSTFISTWAFWAVISYFMSPQLDTRIVSTTINCLFVFAPIPGTVSMIFLNSTYRKFVAENVLRRKRSNVSPSRYALPMQADLKSQFF